MKKIFAFLMTIAILTTLSACSDSSKSKRDEYNKQSENTTKATDPFYTPEIPSGPKVMSHAEFFAAKDKDDIVVEFYVQAAQDWWFNPHLNHGVITLYGQDKSGGSYVSYSTECTEEKAAKLIPGTKVRISGSKMIWRDMHEISEGTIEILSGDTWIAPVTNVTDLLGSDSISKHVGKYVSYTAMTVVETKYQDGVPGKDIYVTLSKDGAEYTFTVESYLTNSSSEVYTAVQALVPGTVIDVEGFLWWFNGLDTHITNVSVVE